jgi:hypothetical protein
VGVIHAAEPNPALLFGEGFEAIAADAHPAVWVDSAPGTNAASSSDLFEVVELAGGVHALGAPASSAEIQSQVDVGPTAWSSYEVRGRIASDTLAGSAGVSVLSRYPDGNTQYLLARVGGGAYALSKRPSGGLTCAGSASTGVRPSRPVPVQDPRNALRRANRPRAPGPARASRRLAVDCWDTASTSIARAAWAWSSGDAGNYWDDLSVRSVTPTARRRGCRRRRLHRRRHATGRHRPRRRHRAGAAPPHPAPTPPPPQRTDATTTPAPTPPIPPAPTPQPPHPAPPPPATGGLWARAGAVVSGAPRR